ncbi:MAG: PKD domain-containing protein [Clostridia bacterium]|nr:PKD domain-containing protein [Clostridia bacterium]
MACVYLHPCVAESIFDKSADLRRESNDTDAKRFDIIYGVDPLSARILDRSIARTWPISSWSILISTDNSLLAWAPTAFYTLTADNNLFINSDRQSYYKTLIDNNIWRYGNYQITMNVCASTTSTSSDKPFIQYIKVSEFEPYAYFWATSAKTVPSTFSADDAAAALNQLVDITPIPNANADDETGTCFNFISGYAPNLTVYFQDSSEAHTFHISSYHWDFGDPFNEGPSDITSLSSNYYTITNVNVTQGDFNFPCWKTDKQQHIAMHTYIMPGTYDVKLTVKANNTGTEATHTKYVEEIDTGKSFYIYVEEINPECNNSVNGSIYSDKLFSNTASSISGVSPLTAYFMPTNIIAGSFPICRIDWDFGDGNIQRITRSPLTTATNQGLSIINQLLYPSDPNDPRNIIVPHIYTTNTKQTYDIHLSAYACNTNTLTHCSAYNLVIIDPPLIETVMGDRKLLSSRFDEKGNLIYLFEGDL